jgi:hypothetical protein
MQYISPFPEVMFIRFLDYPPIPDELVTDVAQSLGNSNLFPYTGEGVMYSQHPVADSIATWFDRHVRTSAGCPESSILTVQHIKAGIRVHKDFGRNLVLNYVVSAGGTDVSTNMYSDDKITVVESHVIPEHKWHVLNVSKHHGVVGITGQRLALSIKLA